MRLFRKTLTRIDKFYKTIFQVVRPSGFTTHVTFAFGGHALMNKINVGFPVRPRKFAYNFRIVSLRFIIYPMEVAAGNQPNDFLARDKLRNFTIHEGPFSQQNLKIIRFLFHSSSKLVYFFFN